MAQQRSYHAPGPLQSQGEAAFGQQGQDESERDELRGVIDDLTVENKRLKNILKTWQSRSSPKSSQGPDRIIEVRMHGLPAERKRELEQILKTFAHGLNDGDSTSQPGSSLPMEKSLPSTEKSLPTGQRPDQTNTDSGYASISGSGLNSSTGAAALSEPLSKRKKAKDIKNYLHDIPDSLFPQDTMSVSESARMNLVVQRLEQLFTGNRAKPGEHSLPVQQQKISRAAAKADRAENRRQNRENKVEGSREARVLPPESKINFDSAELELPQTRTQGQNGKSGVSASDSPASTDRPGSPNQRPTRPLDLDIHRAQVAEDNIKYLRHLGLASPQFGSSPGQEQPWLYLNLLSSMAQLHTLNVTPAFVRKAIKQRSTMFELSKDGHRIRWKGDAMAPVWPDTQVSPASAEPRGSEDMTDEGGRHSVRGSNTSTVNEPSMSLSDDKKQRKLSTVGSKLVTSVGTSSNLALNQTSSKSISSAFDYKPIVFKGKRNPLKAGHSYLDSSSSNGEFSPDDSDLAQALSRSSLKSKDESREGLMTFFSNPYYCTDLSGDRSPVNLRSLDPEDSREVLGLAKAHQPGDSIIRDINACYYTARADPALRAWPTECPDVEMVFKPIEASGEDETQPLEFEASGIGGVRPEDNFALDVKIARTRFRDGGRKEKGKGKARRGIHGQAEYSYRLEKCTQLTLQPSRLPPPSYVFHTSSSSSAEKGHFYDDDSDSDAPDDDFSPGPGGLMWRWSSESNEHLIVDEGSDASSSMGRLEASRTRLGNPGAGARANHDFIIHPSGGTMSGSLAATVGASWSAKSNVEQEPEPAVEEDETSSEMSTDEGSL
ncbi:hypothetical protein PV08_07865 [Exophiala spinifera]|uniref:Frequency clock protein n=1 Tax=Exophiala spinifera TaxID=91928 RepID=A0A0D2B862_9EURO|nr:uncharacterized protein PV08_07865 [Exophiala spinifera]KIW15078.1 hypothetical protein PV08_07865 [Exophiala spinifera]